MPCPSLSSGRRALATFASLVGIASLVACAAPAPTPTSEADAEAVAAEAAKAKAKAADATWTLDFKDPPPGPAAPSTAAFGAVVGTSNFSDIEALVTRLELNCGDTSVRALMDKRREKEKAKAAEAKARGEDAVTSASWVNKRSKREANPQVRFSCPKIDSSQIQDRERPPSSGRLLFVFDTEDQPLRHTSFQRTHKDHAAALADYTATTAALTAVYGPPTTLPRQALPTPGADGSIEFPPAVNFETVWTFADLHVRTTVLRYGNLVTVGERIEVPHGIRPDAPRFLAAAKSDTTPGPL